MTIAHEEFCVDQHTHCIDWALSGECERDPEFMHQGCRASCTLCPSTSCHDQHSVCSQMPRSDCLRNSTFMLAQCRWSCRAEIVHCGVTGDHGLKSLDLGGYDEQVLDFILKLDSSPTLQMSEEDPESLGTMASLSSSSPQDRATRPSYPWDSMRLGSGFRTNDPTNILRRVMLNARRAQDRVRFRDRRLGRLYQPSAAASPVMLVLWWCLVCLLCLIPTVAWLIIQRSCPRHTKHSKGLLSGHTSMSDEDDPSKVADERKDERAREHAGHLATLFTGGLSVPLRRPMSPRRPCDVEFPTDSGPMSPRRHCDIECPPTTSNVATISS